MSEKVDILLRLRSELEGIKRAQDELTKTTKKTNSLAHAFKVGLGVEATRLLSRGFGMVTRQLRQMTGEVGRAIKDLDKLAKTGQRLGVAVADLQVLRHGGTLTGVGESTLDMALQRQTRRVAEAARGTGEAVNALRELHLEAKELVELSPDKQFEAIAEAMRGVSRQGDRVRLAMKLFDSEGVALVNTLGLGAAGFDEIRQRLQAYGIAIDQVDVERIQEANDAWAELRLIQRGFYNQLAIQLSPMLREISTQLAANVIEAGGMEQAVKDLTEPLTDPTFVEGLSDLVEFLRTIARWSIAAAGGVRDFGQGLGFMAAEIALGNGFDSDWSLTRDALAAGEQARRRRRAAAGGPQPGADGVFDLGSVSVPAGRLDLEHDLLRLREERRRLELDAFRTEEQKRPELIRLLERERDLSSELLEIRRRDVEAQLAAAQTPEERAKAFQELAAIEQLQTRLVDIEAQLSRISRFKSEVLAGLVEWMDSFGSLARQVSGVITGTLDTAVNGLTSSIEGMINGTMTARDAWDNLVKSVLAGLVRMVSQFIAQQAVLAAVRLAFGATLAGAALAEASVMTAAWAPAAISASIATAGAAPAAGLASYVAALGTGTGFAQGMAIAGFAEGGLIPGSPSARDNRIIRAATGEFIVQASAVQHYGAGLLEQINSMQLPAGPGAGSASAQPDPGETNIHLSLGDLRNDLIEEMERTAVRAVRADRRRRGERVAG